MKQLLYFIIEVIAKIHTYILSLNDAYETSFTDKELHFLVIGAIGMILVLIIQPIFHYLAKKGLTLVITWIYVFTLMIVLTFAIEIGQGYTGTGNMEFADIMFGLVGFLFMFAVYAVIRSVIRGFLHLFHTH